MMLKRSELPFQIVPALAALAATIAVAAPYVTLDVLFPDFRDGTDLPRFFGPRLL
jgi:hypothetical protein